MAVEDPGRIDFVVKTPTGEALLVMVENRPCEDSSQQLVELQEKLNSYVAFVVDGDLVTQYPELNGLPVRIELRHAGPLTKGVTEFLGKVKKSLSGFSITFQCREIGMPGQTDLPTRRQ